MDRNFIVIGVIFLLKMIWFSNSAFLTHMHIIEKLFTHCHCDWHNRLNMTVCVCVCFGFRRKKCICLGYCSAGSLCTEHSQRNILCSFTHDFVHQPQICTKCFDWAVLCKYCCYCCLKGKELWALKQHFNKIPCFFMEWTLIQESRSFITQNNFYHSISQIHFSSV